MNRINTVKLHRLIKSLKKEEKRYFKLFTKKQNSKEDIFYIKIFDYLDKAEQVDREKFKKKFQAIKGLSGLQNYLYKLILKSLRNQPAYNDVDAIIREGLGDLEILYQKTLYVETQEKFQELLQLATLHDKVFFLPILYEWWFRLQNSYFQYQDVEAAVLNQYTEAYATSIDQLKHYHFYRTQLGQSLMVMKKENVETTANHVRRMLTTLPAYASDVVPHGLSIRIQELQFRRIMAVMLGDTTASYFYSEQLIELLRKQPPEVFKAHASFYYRALISQITHAPTIAALKEIVEEVEITMIEKKQHFDAFVRANIFISKIDIYFLTEAFNELGLYIQGNQDNIAFIIKATSAYLRDFWYYKLMLYHYVTRDFTKALHVFDQFLVVKEMHIRAKGPSLFLKMVIYYEEQEYISLASLIKNSARYFRKNNAFQHPEQQLIALMNKLVKQPPSEHKAIFAQARQGIIADLNGAEESQKEFLLYFNYIGWIDSQISGAPFRQFFFRHTGMIEVQCRVK